MREKIGMLNIFLGGNTTKGGPKSLKFKKAKKLDYYFYNYPSLSEIEKQI